MRSTQDAGPDTSHGGRREPWERSQFSDAELALILLESTPDTLVVADHDGNTVRDLSAQRIAEQVQRNLLQMMEGITEAVYLIDPESLTITYVNAAGCRQTGRTTVQLMGASPACLMVAFNEDSFRATVQPLLDGQASSLTLALLKDRARIARDLHDTVIQELFAAGLALQALALRSAPDVQGRLSDTIDRLDATIRQIRTTIFGLGAHNGQDSLVASVHAVIDDAARILQFQPRFRSSGAIDTAATPELVEHLLPTLRESLSNIARHARATRVDIDLTLLHGLVTLQVLDNGVGCAADALAGNGTRNLAERARQLGGSLTRHDAIPHGTLLTWTART